MTPTKTQIIYWTSVFGEIPVAEDKLAAKSDVIDYVLSADIEVHAESRMIGDAAGLGAFEKILRQVSELTESHAALDGTVAALEGNHAALQRDHVALNGKVAALKGDHAALQRDYAALQRDHTNLEGDHAALQRDHTDLEGKVEALQEFKAKARIPELLGNLPTKKGIDFSARNDAVHGADFKFDLELIRSLKKEGPKIIGGYSLQYDVLCHAFIKAYGRRYKEIPQLVPEEVVRVFNMQSNLMHLHHWDRTLSKTRERRRVDLKHRCDDILERWFSGRPYSKEETEQKFDSMIKDYWDDDNKL